MKKIGKIKRKIYQYSWLPVHSRCTELVYIVEIKNKLNKLKSFCVPHTTNKLKAFSRKF